MQTLSKITNFPIPISHSIPFMQHGSRNIDTVKKGHNGRKPGNIPRTILVESKWKLLEEFHTRKNSWMRSRKTSMSMIKLDLQKSVWTPH